MRGTFLLILVLLLTACSPASALEAQRAPAPTPIVYQPYLGRALAFLARQYDAGSGLLRESAQTAPGKYWLTPDNTLALWVMQAAHGEILAGQVAGSLAHYAAPPHGLIEALHGEAITWPPLAAIERELAPGVWTETRTGGAPVNDWQAYSDLTLYGALHALAAGDRAEAQRLYDRALGQFDGSGFKDPAFDGRYATYKLALALFAGAKLGVAIDRRLLDALLRQQGDDGGFAAHYTVDGAGDDADTATTAYTALALYTLRQP